MSEQTNAGPDYPAEQPVDDGTNPATVGQEPLEQDQDAETEAEAE